MKLELIKQRSLSSCMEAAYTLFTTNFKTIFLRTWVATLVCSLVTAFVTHQATAVMMSQQLEWSAVIAIPIAYLVLIIASMVAYACFFSLINNVSMKRNMRKMGNILLLTVAVYVFVAVLEVVAALILKPTPDAAVQFKTIVVFAAIIIAVALIMLPLAYSVTKYASEADSKLWPTLWTTYKKGLKCWGTIFAVVFVTSIICMIVSFIISIPSFILLNAHMAQAVGIMEGDNIEMPRYFTFIQIATSTATVFLTFYLSYWQMLVMCHMYGNIEAVSENKIEES